MSSTSGTAAPGQLTASGRSSRAFLLRKLHSLSGVLPVGLFLVVHLWTNARVLSGRASFDEGVRRIQAMPGLPFIETFGILLPLAFHAGYGVKLALEPRSNVGLYPYARNWLFVAQRATGLVALAFVLYHLRELWLPRVTGRLAPASFHDVLTAELASTWHGFPLVALAYLGGIAAAVFHFANGLWGFCTSWGITVSRRAQRSAGFAFAVFGLALFAVGAETTLQLATGASVLPRPTAETPACNLPIPATR